MAARGFTTLFSFRPVKAKTQPPREIWTSMTTWKSSAPMPAQETCAEQVGAFEGAGYQAKGLYRSSTDCIKITRNPDLFCPVCVSAIEEVIGLYAD